MLCAWISLSGFDLSEGFPLIPSETAAVDRHTFYFCILVTCWTGIWYLPDNGFEYWNTLGLIFMWSLLVQLKQILLNWPIEYMFTVHVNTCLLYVWLSHKYLNPDSSWTFVCLIYVLNSSTRCSKNTGFKCKRLFLMVFFSVTNWIYIVSSGRKMSLVTHGNLCVKMYSLDFANNRSWVNSL